MARAGKVAVTVTLLLLIAAAAVGARALVRQQSTISGLKHSVALAAGQGVDPLVLAERISALAQSKEPTP